MRHSATLRAVATVLGSLRKDAVEDYSMALPSPSLGAAIVATKELKSRASQLEGWLEDRYHRECPSQVYQDRDGAKWVMRAEREWVMSDADARSLYESLRRLSMDAYQRGLMVAAFKTKPAQMEVDHGLLNQIAGRSREAAEVIREWRGRRYGPLHLVKLEENG
jgi:hypothetical protein